jgi:hypothetical protein
MASSILNSDDGVISGTSGLKSTGGDDGVLVFQSKGTETARINTDKQIVAAAGTASLPIYSTTGDTNTGIFFPAADQVAIATNGVERVNLGNSVTVFNDGGADVDFRVEGDTNANLLFVDASTDRVGIGLNAPLATLEVKPSGTTDNFFTDGIRVSRYANTTQYGTITNNGGMVFTAVETAIGTPVMQFRTSADGTTSTERMRIDSSGNVGIGASPLLTAASRTSLTVNGTSTCILPIATGGTAQGFLFTDGAEFRLSAYENIPLTFHTNNAERMRIGSSGGLSIVNGLGVGTSTIFTSSIFFATAVLSAGAGTYPLKWNSSTGIVTYDTSSRLVKENIEDSPYGLAEVMQLQPRKYFRTDDQKDEIGFVADEVENILPEFVPLVPKSLFTKNEEDEELVAGGVNYEKLTAVLTKAIQELKAELDTVKAELATLKGN